VALTIKNPETIALARQLAQDQGLTQTGAITEALKRSLAETSESSAASRRSRVNRLLQTIWQNAPAGQCERIGQAMANLYDDRGLPR
jgi:hypothetical protein